MNAIQKRHLFLSAILATTTLPATSLAGWRDAYNSARQAVSQTVEPLKLPSVPLPQTPPHSFIPPMPPLEKLYPLNSPLLPENLRHATEALSTNALADVLKIYEGSAGKLKTTIGELSDTWEKTLNVGSLDKLQETMENELQRINVECKDLDTRIARAAGLIRGCEDVKQRVAQLRKITKDAVEDISKASIQATLEEVIYTGFKEDLVSRGRKLKMGEWANENLDRKLKGKLRLIDVAFPVQGLLEHLDFTGMQECIRNKYVSRGGNLDEELVDDRIGSATAIVTGCIDEHFGKQFGDLARSLAPMITSRETAKKEESNQVAASYNTHAEANYAAANIEKLMATITSLERTVSKYEEVLASLKPSSPWIFPASDFSLIPDSIIHDMTEHELSTAIAEIIAKQGLCFRAKERSDLLKGKEAFLKAMPGVFKGLSDDDDILTAYARMNQYELDNVTRLLTALDKRVGLSRYVLWPPVMPSPGKKITFEDSIRLLIRLSASDFSPILGEFKSQSSTYESYTTSFRLQGTQQCFLQLTQDSKTIYWAEYAPNSPKLKHEELVKQIGTLLGADWTQSIIDDLDTDRPKIASRFASKHNKTIIWVTRDVEKGLVRLIVE